MNDSLVAALPHIVAWMQAFGRPWALIGGLAVTLHARPRLTRDIDLMVSVPTGEVDRLLQTAAEASLTWDADEVRQWADGGLVRVRLPGAGVDIDVLFALDDLSDRALARAAVITVAGVDLRVASIEDLILMKLEANRGQDLDDVLALKDAARNQLDHDYLRECAAVLDLSERLAAFVGS